MSHPPFFELSEKKDFKRNIPISSEASYCHLLEAPFHGLLQMATYQFPTKSDTT